MSHYKHITPEEREKILVLRSQNHSITNIADSIGRNKSTVSRELSRNTIDGEYSAVAAQAAYHNRRSRCRRKSKLSDPRIFKIVQEKFLEHQWSPEQVAGRLKQEHSGISISYAIIYRGIYAGLFDTPEERNSHGNRGAVRKLRHKGKTRHTKDHVEKRGKIVISNDLEDRPEAANNRSRIGDWEGDTVVGSQNGHCLVTLADWKSRMLLCQRAEKKASDCVRDVMIKCLKDQPLHSITPDRGKEFAKHVEVTKALDGVPFYFPKPRHPWDRGKTKIPMDFFASTFQKVKIFLSTAMSIYKARWMN